MQHNEPISKHSILAQNIRFKERRLRLRWLLAISSIPLFGIFAAFGIAPQTITQNIPISTITEDIALPQAVAGQYPAAPADFWHVDQVRRDDTLASLMARLNVRNQDALDFLRLDPEASALASGLHPGRTIQAQTTENGELLKLQYQTGPNAALNIERSDSGYQAASVTPEYETRSELKSAEIKSSLFEATDSADIPDHVALQLADIFSSDIDFHSDLRRGDRLMVIYEASYHNGELVKTGQVLAAEFINDGKTYSAIMYRNPEGQASYYTPEGKSLHKSFLRSPLEFSRISSGFSLARFHPILNTMRAHKGVDYAAPIGTRIKAAAEGTVDFAGVKGGYGNVIVLQHQNGISTVYGHMSGFAQGMRRGMKVAQGEIIGFVGMTGLATGPHLHYEFKVNGEQRDPTKIALPTAIPLPAKYQANFAANKASLLAQLNLLNTSKFASRE